jgi:KipI family sensor histidine kinase inhibitor
MVRVLPYGPGGFLVDVDPADVVGYAAAVRAFAHPGVAEVVTAARTVLVRVGHPRALHAVGEGLAGLTPLAGERGDERPVVEIPVVYDGADLDDVAAACGLSVDDVVARHVAPTYTCAFCGFAPGFAYLSGVDRALATTRRSTPRTRVPAGAVAIAAQYSAVYPSASPGGWHLLGRTDAAMWDPARTPPALVTPGTSVRFVPVGP